ncbi:hypothetical protein B0H17DRAFT_1198198 [Mycena rosella]|uniref:Uncharacterized protein n=1 Tax=Mycena rosella TaxID=1033263 RepID=A0AAD7DPQ8_MYCRO|nr:hypothetical protein B0H17DRAFT_1198198 [Mycena rosella]
MSSLYNILLVGPITVQVSIPHIAYAALGGFVVLFGMPLSEKLYIGEACWAFLFGVVIGPYGANIFNPRGWASSGACAVAVRALASDSFRRFPAFLVHILLSIAGQLRPRLALDALPTRWPIHGLQNDLRHGRCARYKVAMTTTVVRPLYLGELTLPIRHDGHYDDDAPDGARAPAPAPHALDTQARSSAG